MSQLIDNLNIIESVKADIKSAIEAKGVDMTGISFPGYASKIGEISGGGGWDQKSLTEGANEMTNLDNSASFVASYAFYGNRSIQTVNLPYATTVSNNAFDYCRSLTKVNLPMCSYIGSSAFQNCSLLTQVSLPVCSHIDTFAFRDCELLSQVSLHVYSLIDSYAFFWCSSLSQISLPVCSDIGIYAFCRCSLLSQVNLPMCSIIGGYAFYNCSSLSQVNLPMCSYIGDSAFYNTHLTILTLGSNSVVSLTGSNQFYPTDMLSIYVPGSLYSQYITDPKWISYSSYIFEQLIWYDNGTLGGSITDISRTDWEPLGISTTDILYVSLPNCTSVSMSTFRACYNLTSVSLPMCENLGPSAFQGCSSLNSIYLPVVSIIGSYCFNNCKSLSSIMLPECITFNKNIFTGCSMLSTIVLPKLQTIDDRAFRVLSNQLEYTLSLYMGGSDVVTTGSAVASTLFFSNIQKHIYVRSSLIDMYQQHSIWGQINNVQWFNYEDSPYYTE